jgi:hypothetical protein
LRIARRTTFPLWEPIGDHDVARLKRRDEELFDIGVEAFAVDEPVDEAGRVDAIVAQRGEESRSLPAAMRNLVDQALALRRPARKRVMLVFVQVSSMNTNRLGSMRP